MGSFDDNMYYSDILNLGLMNNTVGTTEAAFVLVRYPVLGRHSLAPVGDAGSDRLRRTAHSRQTPQAALRH